MGREMKDSGIEWIGEIPKDWTVKRLRYMCNIVTGNQDTQDNDPDGQYPFYVRSPIVEKSNKYTFEGPAILMSGDGAGAGRIFHMVDGKYGCHQRVYSIQDISGINRIVLYHYMSNLFRIMIETANSKSTVDSVRLNMLQDFPVLLPPEEEQEMLSRCLSDTVSRIDNIISKTRNSIDEYKKLKQAVIIQAVTKGLDPNVETKDSGIDWIGEIPVDWNFSRIGGLYSLRTEKVSDRDFDPLSVTMKGVVPQLENAAKTNAHDDRKLVRKGDFVINSRSDRRGSCGISEFDGSVSLINIVLMPRGEMNPKYYNWIFHSDQFADEFYRWGHGIVDDLWTTGWQEMKKIVIPTPSLEEQQNIASFLDAKGAEIDNLITKKEQYLTEIENYKKSLIYEYVTGKKEVSQKCQDGQ